MRLSGREGEDIFMLRYVMMVVLAAGAGIGAAYLKNGGYVDAALETASSTVNGSFETTAASDETQPTANAEVAAEPLTPEEEMEKKIEEAVAENERIGEACANAPALVKMACILRMQQQMQKSLELSGALGDMSKDANDASESE